MTAVVVVGVVAAMVGGRGDGDPPDVDATVVIVVNPSDVNQEGGARIAAMIAGISFIVKERGVVVERWLRFRGSSSVSWLSPEVQVFEGDWREAVAFFLAMELRRAIANSFDQLHVLATAHASVF